MTVEQKMVMAKAGAKLLANLMISFPEDVKLEAALMLTKSLYMGIPAQHRMRIFSTSIQHLRKSLQEHLKTGVVK